MRLYIALSLAVLAFFAHENNAALPSNFQADVVFVVDASSATQNILFDSFILSLERFVNRAEVSNANIRVGVVFVNDQSFRTIEIPLTGDRTFLLGRLSNSANRLLGGLNLGNGLNAAVNLLNSANRPAAKKIVIVLAAGSSSPSVTAAQANLLKTVADQVFAVGVQSLAGIQYNRNELNLIGDLTELTARSNVADQSTVLFSDFDRAVGVAAAGSTVISSNACDDCIMKNGVGYLPYTNSQGVTDGRYYIQCKKEDFGSGIIAYKQMCPDGSFWHNVLKNCVGLLSSDFYSGQCDSGTYLYASQSCGAYWNCTNGIISSQCCPDNTAYDDAAKACVPSVTCQFHCSDLSRAAADCDKVPFVMNNGQINPCKYVVLEGVNQEFRTNASCPAGTHFNQTSCNCNIFSNTCPGAEEDLCQPDTNFDFNLNQIIDTVRGSWVGNENGVFVQNNAAVFNGQNKQRLAFSRYTNIDFGLPLALKIKYRETENRANLGLIGTGDCLSEPGLYVIVGNGAVTLGVHTETEGFATSYETTASTPGINQWKELVFLYDGYRLQGEVRTLDASGNSIINRTPIPAATVSSGQAKRIKTVPGALNLGYVNDARYSGFVGEVDSFSVWKGCTARATPSDY